MRTAGFFRISSLLSALLACSDQTTTGPIEAAPIHVSRGEVPMRGHYEGTGLFTAPPAGCAGFYSVFTGTGRESHTGRYTLEHTTCTVPIDETHSSFTGEFTKTSANGDLMFGTYQGATELIQAPSPIGIFAIEGTITFTGGTGKFEGVAGTQQMTGTQHTDFSRAGFPSRMVLEFDGAISSVGSLH